jgi:hypothetical protein
MYTLWPGLCVLPVITLRGRHAQGCWFVPANGAVLHLFDYASVTGQFAQVVYPSGCVQYNLNVGSTSLTATAAVTSGTFHWFAHQ